MPTKITVQAFFTATLFIFILLPLAVNASQEGERIHIELEQQGPTFVTRGTTVITDLEIDAFLDGVPNGDAARFLSSRDRVSDMIEGLLQVRGIAQLAVRDGLHATPDVNAALIQAISEELTSVYFDQYIKANELSDYDQKARELFITNRENYREPNEFTFVDITIGPEYSIPEYRAVSILNDVFERSGGSADVLESLLEQYSEELNRPLNALTNEDIPQTDIDSEVLFTLQNISEGELSPPFRSERGWHLVRLVATSPGDLPQYEDVRELAVADARRIHRQRLSQSLLSDLSHQDLRLPQESLDRLLERYGVQWQ